VGISNSRVKVNPECQKLIYSGRVLKYDPRYFGQLYVSFLLRRDEETIESYGIQNEQTVHYFPLVCNDLIVVVMTHVQATSASSTRVHSPIQYWPGFGSSVEQPRTCTNPSAEVSEPSGSGSGDYRLDRKTKPALKERTSVPESWAVTIQSALEVPGTPSEFLTDTVTLLLMFYCRCRRLDK